MLNLNNNFSKKKEQLNTLSLIILLYNQRKKEIEYGT